MVPFRKTESHFPLYLLEIPGHCSYKCFSPLYMARKQANSPKVSNGATLGFEQKLWQAADKMRGHMDASEYKHVVLGLIFLKYISDAFEERHAALEKEKGADPEDRDEYLAENIFWVPKQARWSFIQGKAKQTDIGKVIDNAMTEIEKTN